MIEELPRRGEVANEFRALAGSMSDEVFASVFPNIFRVLTEYRENAEGNHSENISGLRRIDSSMDLLGSSFDDLNFQLEVMKNQQNRSLVMLEELKQQLDDDPNSIFDKLLGKIFGGAPRAKGAAGRTKPSAKPEAQKPATKNAAAKPKYSTNIFSKLNIIAAVYAVSEAISRINALDPKDPEYNSKATKEIAAVAARFGFATVGAIAGGMLGSAIPVGGNVAGFVAGLASGMFVDYYYGDNVEEITKNIVDKLLEKKNKKTENIPVNKNLASLATPTDNIFTNNTPQPAAAENSVSVNAGSNIISASGDDVTVAKDIMFGAKKLKFVGDKLFFTNIVGLGGGEGESKTVFQSRQQNKNSQKIQELQNETAGMSSSETTPADTTGSTVTPSSSITGTTTPGSSYGGGTGSSGYNPTGSGVNVTGSAQEAMQFFISKGWTPEQAAGIVGNLMVESANFSPDVLSGRRRGDGGKAFGVAQWHPLRQEKFKEVYGKPIDQATFQEQLEFVNWELNNSEKKAGDALRSTNDPARAAELVDQLYERSSGIHRYQRMNNAVGIMKNQQNKSDKTSSIAPEFGSSNKTASLMEPELKTNGSDLYKTSADVSSTPVNDTESVRQNIQKVATVNNQYSSKSEKTEIVEQEYDEASVKTRLVQHFSHSLA